jgi:hypothetical protein
LSQPNNNTVFLFQQLQNTAYQDGPASSFVDVISFHANAAAFEPCRNRALTVY